MQIRNSTSLMQESAKFISKQLLQNKQMFGPLIIYASFYFSYSTKLFSTFHVRFIKNDKITNVFVKSFVNVANVYYIYDVV